MLRRYVELQTRTPLRRAAQLRTFNRERQARRRASYREHLESAAWQAIRQARLELAKGRCECGCGLPISDASPESRYHCHHVHYQRFGAEHIDDVRAMRRQCHERLEALHFGYRRHGR